MFRSISRPLSYAQSCGIASGRFGTTVNVSCAGEDGGWFGVGPYTGAAAGPKPAPAETLVESQKRLVPLGAMLLTRASAHACQLFSAARP